MTPTGPPPPKLDTASTAFFLDVDGTLAEIVEDPDQVRVKPDVLEVLETLFDASGGALALISGRSIAQIDRITSPLRLPAAGVHGLEWRLADGNLTRQRYDTAAHADLVAQTGRFAATQPGLRIEEKPGSVALHFRNRPELAATCLAFMKEQAARHRRVSLKPGKMVLELIFGVRTKGDAIDDFMGAPPFSGRRPFYAGDDVTDEDGFRHVNERNGMSVRIGSEPTCARYRLRDPGALAKYLARLLGSEVG